MTDPILPHSDPASVEKSVALLFDVDDAAVLIAMTPYRLRRMAKSGLVPHVRLPDGEIRFSRDDLAQWIKECRIDAKKP